MALVWLKLFTKFKIRRFTNFEDRKVNAKFIKKVVGGTYLEIIQGHWKK